MATPSSPFGASATSLLLTSTLALPVQQSHRRRHSFGSSWFCLLPSFAMASVFLLCLLPLQFPVSTRFTIIILRPQSVINFISVFFVFVQFQTLSLMLVLSSSKSRDLGSHAPFMGFNSCDPESSYPGPSCDVEQHQWYLLASNNRKRHRLDPLCSCRRGRLRCPKPYATPSQMGMSNSGLPSEELDHSFIRWMVSLNSGSTGPSCSVGVVCLLLSLYNIK